MRSYLLRESLGEGLGCDYLRDFAQDEVLADTEPLTGVFRILRHRKQVFVNMLGRVGAVVARADLQKAPARPSCRSATSPRCERWQTTWEIAWPPAWCFTGANKPLPSVPGSRRCHFRSCGKEAEPMPHDFGLDAKVLPMPLLRHIG